MTKQEAWKNLIEYIEAHPFCEMKIIFKEGRPVLAEEIKESIKFT